MSAEKVTLAVFKHIKVLVAGVEMLTQYYGMNVVFSKYGCPLIKSIINSLNFFKMRISLLLLLCIAMSYHLMAQEKVKQKEIGLVFSNLDNFGFTFRTGTDRVLWRFNTLLISGNNQNITGDSTVNTQGNIGFDVKIGREYRKVLVDDLELRFGADLSFSYSQSKTEYDFKKANYYRLYEQIIYRPGINLVFGFNYKLSDNFVIGAEILPNFSYITGTSKEKSNNEDAFKSDISGLNYGISNTSVLLSLAYRFQ